MINQAPTKEYKIVGAQCSAHSLINGDLPWHVESWFSSSFGATMQHTSLSLLSQALIILIAGHFFRSDDWAMFDE